MFIKNSLSTPKFQQASKAAPVAKAEAPEEKPLGAHFADTLVRSNDALLPGLSALGLGFAGAAKGIEIGSSFGPVGRLVGAVAGVAAGAYAGHFVASGLNDSVNYLLDTGMGDMSQGAKGAIKTAYGALLFGVVGGPAAAAIYGASAVSGAGLIMRDEVVAKSLPKGLEPGPFRL